MTHLMKYIAACVIAMLAFIAPALAAGASVQTSADKGVPVGTEDLYKLYRDKTWFWPNGAAYFASNGQFDAWSQSSGETAYAKGRWWVNYLGGMCFKAAWHTKSGTKTSLTCFSHRKDGRALYQKKEQGGDWFVFRSSPDRADDEFRSLEDGNLIASDLRTAKDGKDRRERKLTSVPGFPRQLEENKL
jgi:Protein of unknown function (DUF995)